MQKPRNEYERIVVRTPVEDVPEEVLRDMLDEVSFSPVLYRTGMVICPECGHVCIGEDSCPKCGIPFGEPVKPSFNSCVMRDYRWLSVIQHVESEGKAFKVERMFVARSTTARVNKYVRQWTGIEIRTSKDLPEGFSFTRNVNASILVREVYQNWYCEGTRVIMAIPITMMGAMWSRCPFALTADSGMKLKHDDKRWFGGGLYDTLDWWCMDADATRELI